MSNRLAFALAGTVLVGAAALLSAPAIAQQNPAGQQPSPRISVIGEGEVGVAPDMAILNLTVLREADTARAALTANNEAMKQVLAALKEAGIAERDLQTAGLSIQPRYAQPGKDRNGEPKIVGYSVSNAVTVRVRNLADAGGILDKAVGLGVNEWEAVRDAMEVFDIDVSMLAGRYTLLEQESLPLMDECARRGVAIVVAGPFNSGILAGNRKFNYVDAPADILARVEGLRAACEEEGVSLQSAALHFPLIHPAVVTVVSGARTADQIKSNVAWFSQTIPASFWSTLRERGLIAEGTPLPGDGA